MARIVSSPSCLPASASSLAARRATCAETCRPGSRRPRPCNRGNSPATARATGRRRPLRPPPRRDRAMRAGRVALDQVRDQLRQPRVAGGAQHGVDVGHGDPLAAEGQQLLQQRLAVAHRAGRPPGQQRQRLGLGLDPFGRHDLPQPLDDRRRLDAGEIEPLAARQDRDRDLRRLRSCRR